MAEFCKFQQHQLMLLICCELLQLFVDILSAQHYCTQAAEPPAAHQVIHGLQLQRFEIQYQIYARVERLFFVHFLYQYSLDIFNINILIIKYFFVRYL